eukprot:IDg20110t1
MEQQPRECANTLARGVNIKNTPSRYDYRKDHGPLLILKRHTDKVPLLRRSSSSRTRRNQQFRLEIATYTGERFAALDVISEITENINIDTIERKI